MQVHERSGSNSSGVCVGICEVDTSGPNKSSRPAAKEVSWIVDVFELVAAVFDKVTHIVFVPLDMNVADENLFVFGEIAFSSESK